MDDPAELAIEPLFGIVPPLYVRKLSRPEDWELPSDWGREAIIDLRVDRVFRDDRGPLSFWLIASPRDLAQFAIGFNATFPGRGLTTPMQLVALSQEELEKCRADIRESSAPLRCDCANRLHRDMIVDDAGARQMAAICIDSNRSMARLTKGTLKRAKTLLEDERCVAVSDGPCAASLAKKRGCLGWLPFLAQ